jgi:hypothetical protein
MLIMRLRLVLPLFVLIKTGNFNMDGDVQEPDFDLFIANTLAGASSQLP